MKNFILKLLKQTSEDLIFNELEQTKKEFIASEKHRMYQEAMSNYLSRYTQFLEDRQ